RLRVVGFVAGARSARRERGAARGCNEQIDKGGRAHVGVRGHGKPGYPKSPVECAREVTRVLTPVCAGRAWPCATHALGCATRAQVERGKDGRGARAATRPARRTRAPRPGRGSAVRRGRCRSTVPVSVRPGRGTPP